VEAIYREAGPEEAGEIVRLIAAVAAENQWIRTEVPFDLAARAQRMTVALKAGDMVTFFVEIDARVVGEATLHFRLDTAAFAMVVDAAHRGKGYGRELLLRAIDKARERASTRIELAVYAHNAPALKLYRSVGFVESGPPVPELRSDGQHWHAIPMALNLALN
jgi:GNAT superfamily N-acetyltransferase